MELSDRSENGDSSVKDFLDDVRKELLILGFDLDSGAFREEVIWTFMTEIERRLDEELPITDVQADLYETIVKEFGYKTEETLIYVVSGEEQKLDLEKNRIPEEPRNIDSREERLRFRTTSTKPNVKMSRNQAIAEVLKSRDFIDKVSLADRANTLYVKSGGASSKIECIKLSGAIFSILLELDLLELREDGRFRVR